ncbi:MAG: Asp-tRNA(Asn)/Glu-tRNA(Gln) amidotransferase subunit GatA [Alphaproteobacteria bacterium]
MKNELRSFTWTQIREKLLNRAVSAKELVSSYVDAMEATQHLNAYITPTPELALAQAEEADQRIAKGEMRLLDGLPLGIKDLFCTKQIPTTAASRVLEGFISPYESTVTQKLRDAGAITLGKLNLDEFAMGSANLTSAFGPVINPWRSKTDPSKQLVPGGSSGGSSAAVAAGSALAALGTDTGGSIRQPAAFTGVVGFKPTYGRCSRWGVVAFASSLDQPGPLTRDVADAAALLEVMCGHDPKDATSSPHAVPAFSKALGQSVKGLKIGIPKEFLLEGMSEPLLQLWEQGKAWLKQAGAEIVSVSLPHTSYALPAYYIIAPAEASSNLSRYDGVRFGKRMPGENLDELYALTRGEGFGKEVKRRILIGTYVLSHGYYDAYYIKAQKVRARIAQDYTQAFQTVDALLVPSAPTGAFGIEEKQTDPITMYLNDIFTVPISLAGLPAISVPAGLDTEGLPLGLQVVGRSFDEEMVLRVASVLEKAADFKPLPF